MSTLILKIFVSRKGCSPRRFELPSPLRRGIACPPKYNVGGGEVFLKSIFDKKSISTLPTVSGVYLFYGAEDVLMYVGRNSRHHD
jgi:hypothetical protein